MTTMRERLIDHIKGASWDHNQEIYNAEDVLNEILAELREPDDAMLEAAFIDNGRGEYYDSRQATEVWTAMIDAVKEGR